MMLSQNLPFGGGASLSSCLGPLVLARSATETDSYYFSSVPNQPARPPAPHAGRTCTTSGEVLRSYINGLALA